MYWLSMLLTSNINLSSFDTIHTGEEHEGPALRLKGKINPLIGCPTTLVSSLTSLSFCKYFTEFLLSFLQCYSWWLVFSLFCGVPPIFPNTVDNSLTGIIPTELGVLTNLRSLDFGKYFYNLLTSSFLQFAHNFIFLQYFQIQSLTVSVETFHLKLACWQAWLNFILVSISNTHTFMFQIFCFLTFWCSSNIAKCSF